MTTTRINRQRTSRKRRNSETGVAPVVPSLTLAVRGFSQEAARMAAPRSSDQCPAATDGELADNSISWVCEPDFTVKVKPDVPGSAYCAGMGTYFPLMGCSFGSSA